MKPFTRILRSIANACSVALLASVAATQPVVAQDRFPSQPIKIVVPYPAGGSTDLIARQFGDQLARELGQTVIIDNRPGGGTNIGAEAVVKSRADGYTLLFGNNSQVLNPVFGPNPPFPLNALDPVSLVSRVAFVIAANPKTPFNTGSELLAAAKASPGKISVSSAQLELYVELLNAKAGINLLHVPYKGGAPATTDAISGQVNMVYALVPVLLPHIQGGKLKALAVTTGKRLSFLPDVPTLTELGVDYDLAIWYGLLAPAGTPRPVVDRLAAATQKIMSSPEMGQKIRAGGAEPAWSKPEEFQAMLRQDTAFWQQVAKALPHLVQK
ncbi:MAG: tripartite tricarboxylate transporter substrate binding protein [Pseudomonadota bacterium]